MHQKYLILPPKRIDNLPIVDKIAGPNVSFIWRFTLYAFLYIVAVTFIGSTVAASERGDHADN